MPTEKLCVVGLGYIGLPTASVLATRGFDVLGVDISPEIVATINSGNIHIVEPGLHGLVQAAVQSKCLRASTTPEPADIFMIAVPTPFRRHDKSPDLRYVFAATKAIAPHVKAGNLIILESTSPVGTTEKIADMLAQLRPDLQQDNQAPLLVAHCPERVLPGKILQELIGNDRIVGGINALSTQRAAQFYRSFVEGQVIETQSRTAELTKLVENSFRDTNIAFANELSVLCESLDIDVWELISLANRHPRVEILRPGPGVGGHCLAVDPWFIVSSVPQHARLIRTAREINEAKPHWVIQQVKQHANKFKAPSIGFLGLSYKPNIDDLRESPALEIVMQLQKELPRATIMACEPHITAHPQLQLYGLAQTLAQADIVVILVAHQHFQHLTTSSLHDKIVLDICGMLQ